MCMTEPIYFKFNASDMRNSVKMSPPLPIRKKTSEFLENRGEKLLRCYIHPGVYTKLKPHNNVLPGIKSGNIYSRIRCIFVGLLL